MNAPTLWIILPLVFSGMLLPLTRWKRVATSIGSVLALVLAVLAWLLPVGELFRLGILTIEIQPSWVLFGRGFFLESSDRPLMIILNLALAFWFIGASSIDVHPLFIPLGMGMNAVLSAAILVQPLYYGTILFLLAGLIGVVLFVSESRAVHLGVKRFWIFQSLAMPLLLLGGWLLSGTEANPGGIPGAFFIYVLLLLGFSLLLSGVPFQSWLPMVAERINPYIFSFAFFVTSFVALLFSLTFLRQYPWLYSSSWLVIFFSFQGFLLTLLGGVGAIYHRHLGRFMGYALMKEIGVSFLIIGLGLIARDRPLTHAILFMQILPRGIALALLALAYNIYRDHGRTLQIQQIMGVGRAFPFATLAYLVAMLTLAGFPLTGAFPVHLLIWQGWFQQYPLIAFGGIFGSVGVLIGGLRALAVLVRSGEEQIKAAREPLHLILLLTAASALLLLMGIVPQAFFPLLYQMGVTFLQGG